MTQQPLLDSSHAPQNPASWNSDSEEIQEQEKRLFSLIQCHTVALCNNHPLARRIVDRLCMHFKSNLVVKRIDRYTDLRAFIGDPRSSVSYELSEFYNMAKKGGILLIEVLEITKTTIENLQLLEHLLPYNKRKWQLPDYANFSRIDVHPGFYIVLSLPMLKKEQSLPSSFVSRIKTVELPPYQEETKVTPTLNTELGPSDVLVLMKFGIIEYDKWYQDVLRPTVEKFGNCIRMDVPLEDWQSEVTQGIHRVDAVIMDISHDLVGHLSKFMLWELNRLWQSFRSESSGGGRREKMIFISRGLTSIDSRHPHSEFVYSSEIDREMISDMPSSASNLEDLLGFEVRRYDPADSEGYTAFLKWLEERLSPLVQNIPAPLSDSKLGSLVEELKLSSPSTSESEWLEAIYERNFDVCSELSDRSTIPHRIVPLLGDLMTTISVSQVVSIPDYWGFTKMVLKDSPRLRSHYRKLLATTQLSLNDPFVTNFCENVWLALTGIDKSLPQNEKEELAELAIQEQRMFIREVSDHFRYAHLPKEQQQDVLVKLLMEHIFADEKRHRR